MPKSLFYWWARLDSNQGPKDYESPGAPLTPCFYRGEALPGSALKCPSASQRRHSRGTACEPEIYPPGRAPAGRPAAIRRAARVYTPKRSWRVLAVLILAAGCATQGAPDAEFLTATHEMALPDLVRVCNRGAIDHEPDLNGCFEWIGGVCHIYMLPRWVRETRDGDLEGYHRTLGHELDHCRRGFFHGENRGVPLPRPARLF
jgi:hypothetical protein